MNRQDIKPEEGVNQQDEEEKPRVEVKEEERDAGTGMAQGSSSGLGQGQFMPEHPGHPQQPEAAFHPMAGQPGQAQGIPRAPQGTRSRHQVPIAEWTPQDWLEHVLDQGADTQQRVAELTVNLQRAEAQIDATRQTAREVLHGTTDELRRLLETGQTQNLVKPPVPKRFHGTPREDVEQWLFDIEQ